MNKEITAKKFHLKTFGCQMSSRDSELVAGLLLKAGYKIAESEDDADIILFNTCSVRQHAEDRVWSEIGKFKRVKVVGSREKGKSKPHPQSPNPHIPIIGLLGCMAQEHQKNAFKRSPLIDLVVGPNNISQIPELLAQVIKSRHAAMAVDAEHRNPEAYNTEYIARKSQASVNVMEGCDNFCTYCIVPYVRGRERSRPAEDVINEIKALVAKGVKQVMLLGQNVNSYRSCQISDIRSQKSERRRKMDDGRGTNFIDLLCSVNEIEGLEKFEFVTSHPKDANKELFQAMASLEKCGKFLHLPAQSGSDRILKKMKRGYTRAHYLSLIKQARKIIPGLNLTTDIMVGFPSETEADFADTFSLVKEVKFDAAYLFMYSPRPLTAAAKMEDDVPLAEKKRRHTVLLDYQRSLHQSGKK